MLLFSIGYSAKDPGTPVIENPFTDGYTISHRATMAAFRRLTREHFETGIYDCGWRDKEDYVEAKACVVNCLKPKLAVEIRVGDLFDVGVTAGRVMYNGPGVARDAAGAVCDTFNEAFSHKHKWRSMPIVGNDLDPMLAKCAYPTIVIAALNASNREQLEWMIQQGAESMGLLVADALLHYLRGKEPPPT